MKNENNFTEKSSSISSGAFNDVNVGCRVTRDVSVLNCIYNGRARDPDSTFCVYQVSEGYFNYFIAGDFPLELVPGRFYRVSGKVSLKDNVKQITVDEYHSILPTKDEDIVLMLKSLDGIDYDAARIFELTGNDILQQIIESPELVCEKISELDFSLSTVKRWKAVLLSIIGPERTIEFLKGLGLSTAVASKICNDNGYEIIDTIKENPYYLLSVTKSLTFFDCDRIALNMGVDLDDLNRITAAVRFGLNNLLEFTGSTCVSAASLLSVIYKYTSCAIEKQEARECLSKYRNESSFVVERGQYEFDVDTADLFESYMQWYNLPAEEKSAFRYDLYHCPIECIDEAIDQMVLLNSLYVDSWEGEDYYRLSPYAMAEINISDFVYNYTDIYKAPYHPSIVTSHLYQVLDEMSQSSGSTIQLEEMQKQAVINCCSRLSGMSIITGPAGSGKTFILKIIIEVLKKLSGNKDLNVRLLAPTGKAAKVAAKSSGLPSSTIHRFFGNPYGNFGYVDLYVVDEFSMVDELLCEQLFAVIPPDSKVIIMGDTEQLPSIGAGNCLHDFIESNVVPCTRLNVVKRQSARSGILSIANQILAGKEDIASVFSDEHNECEENSGLVTYNDDPSSIRSYVKENVLSRFSIDDFHNDTIQILCPKKAGETGVNVMNHMMQRYLNPAIKDPRALKVSSSVSVSYKDDGKLISEEMFFCVGDRVIHTKNNYDLLWWQLSDDNTFLPTGSRGVMNGETGYIYDIQKVQIACVGEVLRVIVKYGDAGYVFYDGDDVVELMHAYAISIHRSQGSQWPVVFCPIIKNDKMMLSRSLLYTMVTRAQKTLFVVGDRDAINLGIRTSEKNSRVTFLDKELRKRFSM